MIIILSGGMINQSIFDEKFICNALTPMQIEREEMACEEAELGPEKFAERMHMQHKLQEQVKIL